jgi:integrase
VVGSGLPACLPATEEATVLLFRIVLLCGARHGEAVGLRWADADLDTGHPAKMLVAEADGNRTRQRRGTPLSGFEDQGNHQESRRLRVRLY